MYQEKKKKEVEGQNSEDASDNIEDQEITLRSLNMEDMRQAKSQVWGELKIIQLNGHVSLYLGICNILFRVFKNELLKIKAFRKVVQGNIMIDICNLGKRYLDLLKHNLTVTSYVSN